MIIGIGTDIIEVHRMRAVLTDYSTRFIQKIFTESEQAYCASKADPAIHYAARWAAKEAFAKAYRTGIGEHIGWHDVQIERASTGAPHIVLFGAIAEQCRTYKLHVSLTHTHEYAVAMVVIEDILMPSSHQDTR